VTGDLKKRYWDGKQNQLIRYYYYSQRGLALFNEFRYVFMVIFGVYLAMKLTNPVWLVVMFAVSLPLLIGVGWLAVHKVSKVVDWLNVEFATHWGRYTFTLQELQNKLLEDILKELKKNGKAKEL
jgi:hypothetical protein